jgi:cephalosporin-C deacetylase
MKFKILCFVFISSSIFALSKAQVNNWKFNTGDDFSWATVSFNDESWPEINITRNWENQGYNGYDGYAWYRKNIVISSDLKEMARNHGGLRLSLGKIDDADQTYFNGELIGKTGEFPPDYEGKWDAERHYDIPFSKIKWDDTNLIAVRVFDAGGGGGIYGEGHSLSVANSARLFKINPEIANNHVFLDGQEVEYPIRIKNDFDSKIEGNMRLVTKTDFGHVISDQTVFVSLDAGKDQTVSFKIDNSDAGFFTNVVSFENSFINNRVLFCTSKDPEKITSSPDVNPDFKEYWDKAKQELNAVLPRFKMTKAEGYENETIDIFLVEMYSLDNALIRGWYGRPKKPGKYPAVLQLQGYSSEKNPGTLIYDPELISLSMNIRGHGNSRDDINPGFPGYLLHNIDDKEKYIYRGAYIDCVRAIDFLFSRPEVDTTQIVVEGGSQGGALSFAAAALDNQRVKLCIPHVPFLSDFRNYFLIAGWPGNEFSQHVENSGMSWDSIHSTLSYIDIKNLAPWIKAPVIMTIGLCDEVCPPRINFAAYNNLNVPREYYVYPYSGHSMPDEYYQRITGIIKDKLQQYK